MIRTWLFRSRQNETQVQSVLTREWFCKDSNVRKHEWCDASQENLPLTVFQSALNFHAVHNARVCWLAYILTWPVDRRTSSLNICRRKQLVLSNWLLYTVLIFVIYIYWISPQWILDVAFSLNEGLIPLFYCLFCSFTLKYFLNWN